VTTAAQNKPLVDKFHRLVYDLDLQHEVRWMGRRIVKWPSDMIIAQEIIWETRPDLIVETGVFHGTSALYYAQLMDLMDIDGKVVSIDIAYDETHDYPQHPKVEFLLGMSSIDPAVLTLVEEQAESRRTMVILDSDHACDHVLQELRAYSRFVSEGCYLVVEDTNVGGQPVMPNHGPGPMEAIKAWDPVSHGFEQDRSREKFLVSFHPGGYLRRVR
jgi:cephalosporin hydroxylase